MPRPRPIVLAILAGATLAPHAGATPPASARVFAVGLDQPVCIAGAPGDNQHLFVAGLPGEIQVLNAATGALSPTLFLDLRGTIVGQVGDGGLLGLCFDPGYASNGFFYVFYNSAPNPPNDRVLARYHATPGAGVADAGSASVLWRFPRSIGHNGGWIGFGPTNGLLYLSNGDGGTSFTFDAPNRAQTIVNQLAGKMLRIDVHAGDDFPADPLRNYHIPATNPFVNGVGDDEIWSYGVRNPWRCSFDRATGDLYISDVGQDAWEEIDVEPPNSIGGRNYGWKCMEGNHCTGLPGSCTCPSGGLTLPVFEYDHAAGHSITGGYVYRGAAIPALQGRYFFADFQDGGVWTIRVVGGVASELVDRTGELVLPNGTFMSFISCFGEDNAGELYAADYFSGTIYKVLPRIACPADFNGVNALEVQDIFDFLSAWFALDPRADFNGLGGISVQDIFDFLGAWFAGCG